MIDIVKLSKVFHSKKADVIALNEIDLHIEKGTFNLIKGASGCGKSTLLFAIGGMLKPTQGNITSNNKDIYTLSEKELLQYRSREIGFVFQSYHLIPYLTVEENILLVTKSCSEKIDLSNLKAMITDFNLTDRLQHKPSELSVGEKQRVALLRALLIKPTLLIADEPTGNLDPQNSTIIMNHFARYIKDGGTIIMASHGSEADNIADNIVQMEKGKIVAQHSNSPKK
jgi:putative ABC transport system ATP-binding protein